jgi:hypothetical protein
MGKSRLLFDAERDDGRKRSDSVGHFRQAAEDDGMRGVKSAENVEPSI